MKGRPHDWLFAQLGELARRRGMRLGTMQSGEFRLSRELTGSSNYLSVCRYRGRIPDRSVYRALTLLLRNWGLPYTATGHVREDSVPRKNTRQRREYNVLWRRLDRNLEARQSKTNRRGEYTLRWNESKGRLERRFVDDWYPVMRVNGKWAVIGPLELIPDEVVNEARTQLSDDEPGTFPVVKAG